MSEPLTIKCEEMCKNRNHPEVIRAEEFLKELQGVCKKYNVEFDKVQDFFLEMKPSKWGTSQIGLFCIDKGKWIFSSPWGG